MLDFSLHCRENIYGGCLDKSHVLFEGRPSSGLGKITLKSLEQLKEEPCHWHQLIQIEQMQDHLKAWKDWIAKKYSKSPSSPA